MFVITPSISVQLFLLREEDNICTTKKENKNNAGNNPQEARGDRLLPLRNVGHL
jgi:hypothetical protein